MRMNTVQANLTGKPATNADPVIVARELRPLLESRAERTDRAGEIDRDVYEAIRDGDLFKKSHRHAEGELAEAAEVRSYEVLDTRVPA